MSERVERMWCDDCQEWRRSTKQGPNHILHLLLSVVTGGIWLVVWFFLLFKDGWSCGDCGSGNVLFPSAHEARSARIGRGAARRKAKSKRQAPSPTPAAAIPPKPSRDKGPEYVEWLRKYGDK